MRNLMLVLVSFSALSGLNAFAAGDLRPVPGIGPVKIMHLSCQTAKTPLGAFTGVAINDEDGYSATLSGARSGGAAQYMSPIGPYNVKISFEGNTKVYYNSEEGVELTVKYGASRITATFKSAGLSEKMTCADQAI